MNPFRKKGAGRSSGNVPSAGAPYPKLSAITDIVQKWAQVVAIVVAGVWACYHFFLSGAANWDVTLDLTTETLPYKGDLKLLVVHVKSENKSSRSIDVDKSNGSFILTVRKVPEGLTERAVVGTDVGEVVATLNMMPDDGWQLLPNSKFDDTYGVVLPIGSRVSLQAELTREDDSVAIGKFAQVGP